MLVKFWLAGLNIWMKAVARIEPMPKKVPSLDREGGRMQQGSGAGVKPVVGRARAAGGRWGAQSAALCQGKGSLTL